MQEKKRRGVVLRGIARWRANVKRGFCQIYFYAKPSEDEKQGFFLPAGSGARGAKRP
jgi:hypothetical protein